MKKSISIVTMLLLAFVSFSISAQSIVGSWEGLSSRSGEKPGEPMKGNMQFVVTFNPDETGIQSFDGNASANIDQSTELKIRLRGKFAFTWVQEGSNVTIKMDTSQLELNLTENDLEIVSKDPNIQAMMNAYKPQMIQMFHSQFKSALGTSFSKNSTWTNVKIEGDKMRITDEDGLNLTLTRVK